MDPLEIAVREALQNSWDARLGDAQTVGFSWHLLEIGESEAQLLQTVVFAEVPPDGWDPKSSLVAGSVMLAFADRGTTGLRGPTRADWAVGRETEFVDFVRNHGRTKPNAATGTTGGTFGFGKSALLNVSGVRAAIIYTRCLCDAGVESRFIAMALGQEFTADRDGHEVLHTGRHWWGAVSPDGAGRVDPVTGDSADYLAEQLGLAPLLDATTGTVVALLQPEWGDHTEEEADLILQRQAVKYAWAVLQQERHPSLQMSRSWRGSRIEIEPSTLDPEYRAFASCASAIDGSPEPYVSLHEVWCLRPRHFLGTLALALNPVVPSAAPRLLTQPGEALHHVALMREQRLVVRYMPVEAPPPGWTLAGVFLAAPDLGPLFARSESATHDDWIPERLDTRRDRTYIRRAKARIGEIARSTFEVASPRADSAALPLGGFSSYLGGWLTGALGNGAAIVGGAGVSGRDGAGRRGGVVRALRVIPAGEPQSLTMYEGVPATVIPFVAKSPGGPLTFACESDVVIDGARQEGTEAPLGASKPRFLAWLDGGRRVIGREPELEIISARGDITMYAVVSVPPDALISVSITGEHGLEGRQQ